jgi:EF-hand domain pair
MLSSAQLKEAFDGFDKDKSGFLEMDEVVSLANTLGVKTSKKELSDLFTSIDVSNDGKLSFDEFLGWYRVGRHSALSGLLKYQMRIVRAAARPEISALANLQDDEKEISKGTPIIKFEVIDRESNASHLKIRVDSGKAHEALMIAIQQIDPDVSVSKKIPTGKFFLSLESANPEALQKSFEEAIDFAYNIGLETGIFPAEGLDKSMVFKCGINGNRVIITFNPLNFETLAPQFRLFNRALVNLRKSGFEALMKVKSDMTIKNIVAKISRIQPEMSTEEAEAIKDETNLFRFFLKGFTFGLQINGNIEVRNTLFSKLFKEHEARILNDKALYFMYLCFRSGSGKLKLSSDDTYELFMDFLNKNNPNIPDGADLVDFLGELYGESHFHDSVLGLPPLRTLWEAIKEHGKCVADAGYFIPGHCSIIASIKTEGIKELFELVEAGMVEEPDEVVA